MVKQLGTEEKPRPEDHGKQGGKGIHANWDCLVDDPEVDKPAKRKHSSDQNGKLFDRGLGEQHECRATRLPATF